MNMLQFQPLYYKCQVQKKLKQIMQEQNKTTHIGYLTQNIQIAKGLTKISEFEAYIPLMLNQKLYIIECYGSSPGKYQNLYVYTMQTKQWENLTTDVYKFNKSNPYFLKIGSAWATIKNNLYVFGGKDAKEKLDNQLASLNLTYLMWKTDFDLHNKQYLPQPRTQATLLAFKDSHLILYGGKTASQLQSTTCFWVFSLSYGNWACVPNPIPAIIRNPSLCLQNQNLYILSRQNQSQSESVIHKIELNRAKNNETVQLKLQWAKIQNSGQDQIRYISSGTNFKMFSLSESFILIFQINNPNSEVLGTVKVWLYDAMSNQLQSTNMKIASSAKYIIKTDKDIFYLLKSSNRIQEMLKLEVEDRQLGIAKKSLRFRQWRNCEICFQTLKNQNQLMESAFKLHTKLIQSVTQKVSFPFAAVGLLADNYLAHSASFMNIKYYTYKQSDIIRIQDDNHSNLTNQQLQEVIVNFQAEISYNYNSVERRSRNLKAKDFFKKELGINLKMAALRLGTQMLYVSINSLNEVRVAWFGMDQDQYVCHFYVFDEKTGKLLQDYSIESQQFIQSKYLELINENVMKNISTKHSHYRHSLYIIGLRKIYNQNGQLVPQLQISNTRNDILYKSNNSKVFQKWSEFGSRIHQSIDVSLASYLSMLFLKNEHMKISLQIFDGEKKNLCKEDMLDNLDRTSWCKYAIPINTELASFDLKNIDLVVNNKMNKRIGIFANGILLYQRNKLIKRFACQLGELLNQLELVNYPSYQYFNIFGSIELPDAVQVNQQKTDFINPMMMEKFYSKIKCIHEVFDLQKDYQSEQMKSIAPKQSTQKMKLRRIQQADVNVPRKKVKKQHEDESYSAN